jgi:hypothetical protein
MATKLWQTEGIKNHLLMVQAGVRASLPADLIQDTDGRWAAHQAGAEAVITCLAERFGINLNNERSKRPQTGELRLKTWTLKDVERNLRVVWLILCTGSPLPEELEGRLGAYYQGIKKTLTLVALSFGLEEFSLS